ncbi:sugar phosphate isomerase/epimerase family protein [Paenibacillus nasutitermitis]|uniref:Xylose isomerase-like TIM barrel domain-containing protein n=1 Tax=Paenibacillus nasutitermitis TaxID=1652958 RepID=A0A916Z8S6_9BACL|nr:sugar phosphate isomerase/epimerase [Paenibacillus nasutitermitis]GGD80127.1 hypothetical protein GCM10010911_42800 [Paenibacillus nasutitermitis]
MMNSTIKLGCMTLPYAKYSFERALEGIAAAGFRYVSIGLPHEGKPVFSDGVAGEAAKIMRLLERYELKPVTLVSSDAFAPSQPIERTLQRLDFAQELGVKELLSLGTTSYRKFPTEPISAEEMEVLNAAFAEKYRLVGEEAGKRGLVVTIKPHTGNTATAAVITETLQRIGSPHICASYDPGNVRFYEGIDPADDLPLIAPELVSFVAKDHRGARAEPNFPVPGEGDVNFSSMFAAMKATGFTGSVVVERLDDRGEPITIEELDQKVVRARENLQRLLVSAGFDLEH